MNLENKIKKNFDLTPFNTFRISGRAEYFLPVKNKEELVRAVSWAKEKSLPLEILSGGSNILITRKKIKGLVLKISGEDYFIKGNYLTAWAGAGLTKLGIISANHGLSGLEWAYGIPGSLGGAVRGNAGAYGSDISMQVVEVEAYNPVKALFVKLNKRACNFSYRHSIFKDKNNLIIVNSKLKLTSRRKEDIKVMARKNFANRLLTLPREPSAGCIFKNLELAMLVKQNNKLAKELKAKGVLKGDKLGAGYLIDRLGLKGKTVGGAKVSEKHANFIINTGKASAIDVIKLTNIIKNEVRKNYKINLEEEIQYF